MRTSTKNANAPVVKTEALAEASKPAEESQRVVDTATAASILPRANVPDIGGAEDRDTWLTPRRIVETVRLATGRGIDLDPATLSSNPTAAREWYALQRGEDGLAIPWHSDRHGRPIKTVFVNPPYCNRALPVWVGHAIQQANRYGLAVWMLIPAATETAYGQAALSAAQDVLFIRGRVRHMRPDGSDKGSPKFGSMMVALGEASCAGMVDLGIVVNRREGAI